MYCMYIDCNVFSKTLFFTVVSETSSARERAAAMKLAQWTRDYGVPQADLKASASSPSGLSLSQATLVIIVSPLPRSPGGSSHHYQ